MSQPAKSYIVFTEWEYGGKTQVWAVESTSGSFLGKVKWFGRWRCYCFFPDHETVFNRGCLDDIARFCDSKTRAHLRKT